MPRKLAEDANQVIQILANRGTLEHWNFVAIDNKSEKEVAKILKESIFFLSFNYREGFGLPPVEAMACGCYVIGYAGGGGKEYFNTEFSSQIEDGNIILFAKEIENLVKEYEISPEKIIEKGYLASKYVLNQYNKVNEQDDIIKAWNSFEQKNINR